MQDPYKLIGIISFWDLGRPKPSLEQLVQMAKQFNRDAGIGFFARLNVYLSLAYSSRGPREAIAVQEKLTCQVLSPDRLQEVVSTFADGDLYDSRILLSRSQLLVAIKLVALYGSEEDGNSLENDDERWKAGEFALAINSCYGPDLGEPNWPITDAIVQLLASAELHNSESLGNGFVRTKMLLGPILRDYTASRKAQELPPPFERIFTLLNGLSFRDFLDISMYLHMEHSQMLTEMMDTDTMAYADVTEPKRYVSGKSMKAWAELMAIDAKSLKELVHGSERDAAFFFDFTVFRRFPLWRSGERYFCIDAMFLAERLSSTGFYWTVVNGLVDQELRLSFQRVWGELIQEYVRGLMDESHHGGEGAFVRKPVYLDNGEEVFDSALVIGSSIIPIEIKSSVLPIEQKYAGEAGPFNQGLSAKFGSGPGGTVEQLVRNIGQIFSPTHPRVSASIPAGQISEIFPIVVVHEPILRFGLVAHALTKEFAAGLSGLALREGLKTYPIQLLTIEDLERLAPHLQFGDFTLVDCLRAKAGDDPRNRLGFWSFVVTRFMPKRGIRLRPNAKLLGRFDWLAKAMMWRVYRGDYYDHSLASRGEPSERAVICARPIGGDELLWDEVIGFQSYETVEEAYKAIHELVDKDFPKQEISADWFECAVVDEFGYLVAERASVDSAEDHSLHL